MKFTQKAKRWNTVLGSLLLYFLGKVVCQKGVMFKQSFYFIYKYGSKPGQSSGKFREAFQVGFESVKLWSTEGRENFILLIRI